MSHYSLLCVLPPQVDIDTDAGQAFLSEVLSHYDENNENARAPKWDWWVIGGRWRGHFKQKAPVGVVATRGSHPRWDKPREPGRCDGGPRASLDLEGMREDAAAKAERDWNEYAAITYGTPQPQRWATFVRRHEESEREVLGQSWRDAFDACYEQARAEFGFPEADEAFWSWLDEQPDGFCESEAYVALKARQDELVEAARARRDGDPRYYSIEQARADYHAQPRVQACRDAEAYKEWLLNSPVDEFDAYTREEYVARKAAQVVPGYATLVVTSDDPELRDYDHHWLARGEMGWFGCGSDTSESTDYYTKTVNELLDRPEYADAVLVVVDCHI